MRHLVLILTGLALAAGTWLYAAPQDTVLERAKMLHKRIPLTDGHNDLPWQYRTKAGRDVWAMDIRQPQPQLHTDIPRLREGCLGAQFWSVYVPASMQGKEAVRATLEEIDIVYQMIHRYPDTFQLALTADEVEAVFKAGKIASMMGIEGGHSIDGSLGALRMFYTLGVRYLTLTHSSNVPWADSATDSARVDGLTAFGKEVVREMNRLGMLVDLSHVAPSTMHDALDVSEAPVIFSHSSARALCDHPRDVPDDVLRRLPKNGGLVMVTFVPAFVSEEVRQHGVRRNAELARLRALAGSTDESVRTGLETWGKSHPEPQATLSQVADHIDHIRKVAGIDHVGLGGDFDGIDTVPIGLEDVSKYPMLTVELIRRGYSDNDILSVLGGNALRVMRVAETTATRLQKTRNPSGARIEILDAPAKEMP
ncbi:MAG: dipeptidase [candidate division Zixibacteria bacterium]|nr:dipeptidase [candidate division Zixibacteria bacterium]